MLKWRYSKFRKHGFNLSNGIIPSVSGDTIRSEKIILSLF